MCKRERERNTTLFYQLQSGAQRDKNSDGKKWIGFFSWASECPRFQCDRLERERRDRSISIKGVPHSLCVRISVLRTRLLALTLMYVVSMERNANAQRESTWKEKERAIEYTYQSSQQKQVWMGWKMGLGQAACLSRISLICLPAAQTEIFIVA